MSNKRFYFWKMRDDFFERYEIRSIEQMEDGPAMLCCYLRMMSVTVQSGGVWLRRGNLPTMEDELALVVRENRDLVKRVVDAAEQLGLAAREDGRVVFRDIETNIGCETSDAVRKRDRKPAGITAPGRSAKRDTSLLAEAIKES